ncbi:MAG: hypothetical protein MZU97_01300 [Bacillus subtilis]|nr:hypothetical protein [Bacillus subtilis]
MFNVKSMLATLEHNHGFRRRVPRTRHHGLQLRRFVLPKSLFLDALEALQYFLEHNPLRRHRRLRPASSRSNRSC